MKEKSALKQNKVVSFSFFLFAILVSLLPFNSVLPLGVETLFDLLIPSGGAGVGLLCPL